MLVANTSISTVKVSVELISIFVQTVKTCLSTSQICIGIDQDGLRLSLVKNKAKHFAQPMQLLSEYLEVIL